MHCIAQGVTWAVGNTQSTPTLVYTSLHNHHWGPMFLYNQLYTSLFLYLVNFHRAARMVLAWYLQGEPTEPILPAVKTNCHKTHFCKVVKSSFKLR